MSGHTKEPWAVSIEPESYPESDDADYPAIIRSASGALIVYMPEEYKYDGDYKANARRIVSCVNALSGVKNPAALPALIEAAKNLCDWEQPRTQEQWDELRDALAKLQGDAA